MSVWADNQIKQLLAEAKRLTALTTELEARIYVLEARLNTQHVTPPEVVLKRGPGRPPKHATG